MEKKVLSHKLRSGCGKSSYIWLIMQPTLRPLPSKWLGVDYEVLPRHGPECALFLTWVEGGKYYLKPSNVNDI